MKCLKIPNTINTTVDISIVALTYSNPQTNYFSLYNNNSLNQIYQLTQPMSSLVSPYENQAPLLSMISSLTP